ncbi:MAG: hypothetical protein HY689_08305 [Chloroflexi bacterium]|nr:hypothetical protein [Chloroflexota bacterium]
MTQQHDAANVLQAGQLNLPVSLQPAARRLFETPMGPVARQVVQVVVQAKRAGLPVALLEIKVATDPELESWQEIVVRVNLMCTPEVALRAWEELAARLEDLRTRLDPLQRELFDEAVAFQVAWPEV